MPQPQLRLYTSRPGQPKIQVARKVSFLHQHHFKKTAMAKMLGVSLSTIKRRAREGLLQRNRMPPNQLDEHIRLITTENPSFGYRSVRAQLLADVGIQATYSEVRASMRRIDPDGLSRWNNGIHRRIYKASGPNYLWHLDGNHKLIRWKIVIHGCIDGFSRLVTYLVAADNNKGSTVLKAFVEACLQYQLPSRIRCDKGGENREVAAFILATRGSGRRSVITGSSVHNQRIERLWRDVFNGVLYRYYNIFSYLEDQNLLNVDDDLQMFALHYSFLPLLQKKLDSFRQMYNVHPIRTANNQSPTQLFISGALNPAFSDCTGVQDIIKGRNWMNEVFNIPAEEYVSNSIVDVPAIRSPLGNAQLEELKTHLNPVRDCNDGYGFDVYVTCLKYFWDHKDDLYRN